MGIFSNFFKSVKVKLTGYIGYQSHSASFDKEVWYHDTFRATVDAIASHGSKVEFRAVKLDKDGRIKSTDRSDPMCRLLNLKPNEAMTATEFKYRMIANLETKTTAVAYVKWEGTKPVGIYPVDFTSYEFKQITTGGLALEFTDYEGVTRALPLEACVVIRKFYNDRLASGDGNGPIYKVLDMSKASDDGMIKFFESTNKIRGLLKQKRSMLDPKDVEKTSQEFAAQFDKAANTGGILAIDPSQEFQELKIDTASPNAAQMSYITNRIYTYLRTSEKIVQNTYSEQEGMAWRQGKLEPIWKIMEEAFTSVYYTKHEIECGNKLMATCAVAMGMSINSITQILNTTKETGDLTTNERRELLGYEPVEGGDVRQISLNFVQAGDQSTYQTGKQGKEGKDGSNGSKEGDKDQK